MNIMFILEGDERELLLLRSKDIHLLSVLVGLRVFKVPLWKRLVRALHSLFIIVTNVISQIHFFGRGICLHRALFLFFS